MSICQKHPTLTSQKYMPYKEEILALSPEEKIALAEELWGSVENELLPITEEERLKCRKLIRLKA